MHLSVEFIHPVIVGKRALPALDVSMAPAAWIQALCSKDDMVVVLGPPRGEPQGAQILAAARARGAMTLAFPGEGADFSVAAVTDDEHVHQEIFELLGHCMYESVHVFLEHAFGTGHHQEAFSGEQLPSSAASFLYPFLEQNVQRPDSLVGDVAASIRQKATDAAALREQIARAQSENIAKAAALLRERIERGATVLTFGNGGSATDATDFALDCIMPTASWPPVPAISLALEPAVITATANDVGADLIFVRQIIAQSKPQDAAIAFSTSGGSRNVVAALEEARKRGLLTIALLGYDGGEIARRNLADVAIVVECDYIPRIQEAQATVYHVLREQLAAC
jgi:D-sedoheptulose 7-phosphate isomerase